MTSSLSDQIEAAFFACRDMDASLNERLNAFAVALRSINASFADAVDRLIDRLKDAEVGAGAPKVGDSMPRFHLPDENGRFVSLDDLLRSGPVAVVVNRGHWCPYCRINTRVLAQAEPRIKAAGGKIVAIIPDRQRYAAAIRAEANSDFPILTDMDNGYAMGLNLVFWVGDEMRQFMTAAGRNLTAYQGSESWTLPVPASFIVDGDGRVKARFVDPDYRKRMTIEKMLEAFQACSSSG